MKQAVYLLSRTLQRYEFISDEGRAILGIVNQYAKSGSLLLQYDENRLEHSKDLHAKATGIDYLQSKAAIKMLKCELNIKAGIIVTRREDEKIQSDSGTIHVVQDWRFLLILSAGSVEP